MRVLFLIWAQAWLVTAQEMRAPETVESLHRQFLVAVDEEKKKEVLERLERTPPISTRDMSALYDIFIRFSDINVRRSLMKSLENIDRNRATLMESLVLGHLQADESESVIFGINSALRLRSDKALPLLHKITKKKFPGKSPGQLSLLSDKNAWWVQYEALSALAQWEGVKLLPLLKRKTKETPEAARIIASFFWKESFPQIVEWSLSDAADQEKARIAAEASVSYEALRETRPRMLELLHDAKTNKDLRHQLALKIGMSSGESELTGLVKEYEEPQHKDSRIFLAAAIFASRSRQGVGILKQYAHESPDSRARAAALFQLRGMLAPGEYRQLLEWAAKSDPDQENRQDAQREIGFLKN